MKKILLAIALVLAIGIGANAQRGGDGFFNNWDDLGNGLDKFDDFDNGLRGGGPGTPGHGGGDQPAPLGSGLLILGALGAGYALTKKRNQRILVSLKLRV